MLNVVDYSEVVQLIYEAALDFNRWPAVLERLADEVGASVACLVRQDYAKSEGAMIMVRTDPKFAQLYADYYVRLNVFAQRVGNRPPQTFVTDRMFISKEDLFRTEFYDGFMKPQGVHSLLNMFLLADGERGTRIALARSPQAGEWEQEHIERLRLFAPHTHRAASINRQLELLRLGAEGAVSGLDQLAHGVLVVDADCRVRLINLAAEAMLAAADGLVSGVQGVATANRLETATLRRMVAEAANGQVSSASRFALNVTRPACCGHYSLLVMPSGSLPGWFLGQRPGAIIFVRDPERAPSAPPSHLRQVYGLTPAEAAVTMEIVRGGGLQSAASAMGISLSTARTHLQRVFQKTGTHRQGELVRLVVELQAGLNFDCLSGATGRLAKIRTSHRLDSQSVP
ncbi:helix-turn-helix transcriptional regulator [Rhodopila sp.]|uniref:helix-turn-helix transcriptional regulator n=1 Tax=Rhodopila sp. TaxID=2480087 RepID=UPI003D11BF0B